MTNSDTASQSGWDNCQGGEIANLVQSLKRQRAHSRRTQISQSLAIAAGLLVMVGIGWMMLPDGRPAGEANYGGIVCSDVVKNAKGYVLHELDPELSERIRVHLSQCENCQHKMTMLRERLGIIPATPDKTQDKNQARLARATTIAALFAGP